MIFLYLTIYQPAERVNRKPLCAAGRFCYTVGKKGGDPMLGAIIGDIAGSVYEFSSIKTKEFPLFGDRRGHRCRFTDDSAMTLAVAGALLEAAEGGGELSAAAVRWVQRVGRKYPDAGYGGTFVRGSAGDGFSPAAAAAVSGSALRIFPFSSMDGTSVRLCFIP